MRHPFRRDNPALCQGGRGWMDGWMMIRTVHGGKIHHPVRSPALPPSGTSSSSPSRPLSISFFFPFSSLFFPPPLFPFLFFLSYPILSSGSQPQSRKAISNSLVSCLCSCSPVLSSISLYVLPLLFLQHSLT
ncbi:hypothetical protein BJX96DRAFT_112441 [Aspergillus floccosus]